MLAGDVGDCGLFSPAARADRVGSVYEESSGC
jgi:hypothetical protein